MAADWREFAPAKVNLFLHVRGRRPDGLHTLESLVVFPTIGDELIAEPSGTTTLSVGGPFGMNLGTGNDNLVIRAVEGLAALAQCRAGIALHLDKRLPVASGIGGGSADAAAALRLASRVWGISPEPSALAGLALSLGADVPVCLGSTAAMMSGIGDIVRSAPILPGFWLVLVNPMRAVSTAAVFNALERRDNPPGPIVPEKFADVRELADWLAAQRNDLEAPAVALQPVIGIVLERLRSMPTCLFSAMSGSGATCFGLFANQPEALSGAERLRGVGNPWWVAVGEVS